MSEISLKRMCYEISYRPFLPLGKLCNKSTLVQFETIIIVKRTSRIISSLLLRQWGGGDMKGIIENVIKWSYYRDRRRPPPLEGKWTMKELRGVIVSELKIIVWQKKAATEDLQSLSLRVYLRGTMGPKLKSNRGGPLSKASFFSWSGTERHALINSRIETRLLLRVLIFPAMKNYSTLEYST